MTNDQALKALQQEVASHPRLVDLLQRVVEDSVLHTSVRMGRESDHIMLVRLSENIACLTKFHDLITANVPKNRTKGA